MTRDRIVRIGVVLVCAVGVLLLYLHQLTVVQHDAWLTRSYMNRWAFRDVPTRRGAVYDREGRMLARDVPGHELELRYWQGRREHPVGAVLHGADLLRRALDSGEPPRWTDDDREFERAFRQLLALPMAWLGTEEIAWAGIDRLPRYRDAPRGVGRDLRFYASSAIAGLLHVPQSRVAKALRDALGSGGGRRVAGGG